MGELSMIGFIPKSSSFTLTNQAIAGFPGFLCDASSGDIVVTLPSPSEFRDGQIFVIVKNDSSGNKVRVETADQQIIDDSDYFFESTVPNSHIMLAVMEGRWRIFMNDADNFTVP